MMRGGRRDTLRATLTSAICVVLAQAVPAKAGVCPDLYELIEKLAVEPTKYFDTFTFQKEGRGDSILLLLKKGPGSGQKVQGWLFLNRVEKDTNNFCVKGEGDGFGLLADTHDNASEKRFGMPGSGYARCATFNKILPPSMVVRMWANRELGQSTIFYGESKSTSGFDFLISKDNHWIIIEDEKKEGSQASCYFERGSGILIHQDLTKTK